MKWKIRLEQLSSKEEFSTSFLNMKKGTPGESENFFEHFHKIGVEQMYHRKKLDRKSLTYKTDIT